MNELLIASKSVIDCWDNLRPIEISLRNLRKVIEQIESQKSEEFDEWWAKQNLWDWYINKRDSAEISWTAAQQAERERCALLCELLPYGSGLAGKTYAEALRGVGYGGKLAALVENELT